MYFDPSGAKGVGSGLVWLLGFVVVARVVACDWLGSRLFNHLEHGETMFRFLRLMD